MSTQGAHWPITAAAPVTARQELDGQQAVREAGGKGEQSGLSHSKCS